MSETFRAVVLRAMLSRLSRSALFLTPQPKVHLHCKCCKSKGQKYNLRYHSLLGFSFLKCDGRETLLTADDCYHLRHGSIGCYNDAFSKSWKACSSICNGALYIGPRGLRCRDYCKGDTSERNFYVY